MASVVPFRTAILIVFPSVKANKVAKKCNLLTQGSEEETQENKSTRSPKENVFLS